METIQTETGQSEDLAFRIVLNGAKYAPLLVQRESFNSKVGRAAARKTYQTAYAPSVFPSATCISSGEL
jgi:hypothetical protein